MPATKRATEETSKTASKTTTKSADKLATKPASKSATKAATKAATKSANKLADQPASEPTTKTTAKAATKADTKVDTKAAAKVVGESAPALAAEAKPSETKVTRPVATTRKPSKTALSPSEVTPLALLTPSKPARRRRSGAAKPRKLKGATTTWPFPTGSRP